jgi:hypothetical protein
MFLISLIPTILTTKLTSFLGSRLGPLVIALLVGFLIGWKVVGGYYAGIALKEKQAELALIKERLKKTVEVAFKYREDLTEQQIVFDKFKEENAKDLPSPNTHSLPSRRVRRLNEIR